MKLTFNNRLLCTFFSVGHKNKQISREKHFCPGTFFKIQNAGMSWQKPQYLLIAKATFGDKSDFKKQ